MEKTQDLYGDFWQYLSKPQQDLILEGNYLLSMFRKNSAETTFQDYSFLIFPFAKAYEGFLKKLFLDAHYISHLDYISDHLRLGKLLSPFLEERLQNRSLFGRVKKEVNADLASIMWDTWRLGRNEIFHYFPHNLRSVSLSQAEEIISQIIQTMEKSYAGLKPLLKSENTSAVS